MVSVSPAKGIHAQDIRRIWIYFRINRGHEPSIIREHDYRTIRQMGRQTDRGTDRQTDRRYTDGKVQEQTYIDRQAGSRKPDRQVKTGNHVERMSDKKRFIYSYSDSDVSVKAGESIGLPQVHNRNYCMRQEERKTESVGITSRTKQCRCQYKAPITKDFWCQAQVTSTATIHLPNT